MQELLFTAAIISLIGLHPALAHEGEDHLKTEQHGQHEPSAVHDETVHMKEILIKPWPNLKRAKVR